MLQSLGIRGARLSRIALCTTLFSLAPSPLEPVALGEASRFVRVRRGVVDARTGVEWRDGDPRMLDWESAREHCRDLDGSGAWRLPVVRELRAMIEPTAAVSGGFALVREVFGRPTGTAYWSSDGRSRQDARHRLAVDEDGSVELVSTLTPLAVRCVRRVAR